MYNICPILLNLNEGLNFLYSLEIYIFLHSEGVYSNDWTSSNAKNITPIPYFIIAQRLLEKRTEEHSRLKTELSSLREQ